MFCTASLPFNGAVTLPPCVALLLPLHLAGTHSPALPHPLCKPLLRSCRVSFRPLLVRLLRAFTHLLALVSICDFHLTTLLLQLGRVVILTPSFGTTHSHRFYHACSLPVLSHSLARNNLDVGELALRPQFVQGSEAQDLCRRNRGN